ncbi:hypothetical protein F183_A13950 [Bryobacterales bacterium F-183]|nr:hypothetical protein F183_A13950 [Bryobacterales bacterium F-183]
MTPSTRIAVLACAGLVSAHAQTPHKDPDEGTLSSVRPRIPEPMVFDLIRPLGAQRGEFEVNSLFRISPFAGSGRRSLYWAPEVEYAFAKGYGLEFEVPLANQHIDSWKGAIQGTLPGPAPRVFIHGWQAIGEVNSQNRSEHDISLLYLAGARWHPRWSVFSMTGAARETRSATSYAFLGNYSLFYHQSRTVTYGLETNWKGPGQTGRSTLLMPQLQLRKTRLNLQLGAGWRKQSGSPGALQLGWRLSREF